MYPINRYDIPGTWYLVYDVQHHHGREYVYTYCRSGYRWAQADGLLVIVLSLPVTPVKKTIGAPAVVYPRKETRRLSNYSSIHS